MTGDDARRLRLRTTFDGVAERYDAVRPRYPPALVDDLVALVPGRRVLEIGCGTGQLTVDLARRGLAVTAVEVSHVAGGTEPFFAEVQRCYERFGPVLGDLPVAPAHVLQPHRAPRRPARRLFRLHRSPDRRAVRRLGHEALPRGARRGAATMNRAGPTGLQRGTPRRRRT